MLQYNKIRRSVELAELDLEAKGKMTEKKQEEYFISRFNFYNEVLSDDDDLFLIDDDDESRTLIED